jgi:hypothetical protein
LGLNNGPNQTWAWIAPFIQYEYELLHILKERGIKFSCLLLFQGDIKADSLQKQISHHHFNYYKYTNYSANVLIKSYSGPKNLGPIASLGPTSP